MFTHCRARALAVLLVAISAGAPNAVLAQTFPSRPIEMVIHSNPGAGQDVFGRLVAEISAREKLLPQPFTVVNRPGGSGAVASTFMKSKRGDPHYLLSLSSTIVLALAQRPDGTLPLDIYTPVALFGFDLQSVTVPVDSKFRTFKDLVDAAKQSPDTIVNGIASATGTARFFQYQLEKLTGARFKYVSFKSGSSLQAMGLMTFGGAFSIAVAEMLLRGLKIKLPIAFRVPLHALLALFFAFPMWVCPEVTSASPEQARWRVAVFPTIAAMISLALLPAIRLGSKSVQDNGTPWSWPWFPWSVFAFLGGEIGRAHV